MEADGACQRADAPPKGEEVAEAPRSTVWPRHSGRVAQENLGASRPFDTINPTVIPFVLINNEMAAGGEVIGAFQAGSHGLCGRRREPGERAEAPRVSG